MKRVLMSLAAASLLLGACQQSSGADAAAPAAAKAATSEAVATDQAIGKQTVTGTLNSFTDAGYPMFVAVIGPPGATEDSPEAVTILFQDQNGPLEASAIEAMVGKQVTANYEVVAEFRMRDAQEGGKSLIPVDEYRPAYTAQPDDKSITGVVSVPEGDEGDLPSEVTVTAEDGTKITVRDFIAGTGLQGANGKTITLIYAPDTTTNLLDITLVP
jgi:hypothetical protein